MAGGTQLRWHLPLGMGTRSGPASREITGWCGGWGGNCIRPPVPAVNPESSCLQLSEALSVSSSPSGDNWSCTVCKHVFGFKDKFQSEDLYICPARRGEFKKSVFNFFSKKRAAFLN